MQIGKSKHILKRLLQVEVSRRNAGDANITVIDGSALLWTVHWPTDGCATDSVMNVKKRIASYLTSSDVYLIFDRYHEYGIKSTTRDGRETGVILGNITCFQQQSCLPRRLSCLQLKTRNSWFKSCMMSWLKTGCFICRVSGITSWLWQERIVAPLKSETKKEIFGTTWKPTKKRLI